MASQGFNPEKKVLTNSPDQKCQSLKDAPLSKTSPPLLDTLAQLRKNADTPENLELEARTKYGDRKTLKKRARAKYFTMGILLKLIDIKSSPLNKAYWNTWHCCHDLLQQEDLILGKYCKNRWCLVCGRIRTAQLIKKYYPVIKTWADKQFITLTVPNCSAELLRDTIVDMESQFSRIKDLARKNNNKLVGVRKLEITYNPNRRDYHPHYHFVVINKENAEFVLSEWLKRYPDASELAQDIREADDNSVQELFKYFTKVVSSQSKDHTIYADALDNIFKAVKNKRVFQNFGFKIGSASETISNPEADVLTDELKEKTFYIWQQEFNDWFNVDTGEELTGYQLEDKFRKLIEKKVIYQDSTVTDEKPERLRRWDKEPPSLELSEYQKVITDKKGQISLFKNKETGENGAFSR